MEIKFYYFDEKGEPKRANNDVNALYLASQGVKMYTKEEAQKEYLLKHAKKEAPKAEAEEAPKAEAPKAEKATPKKNKK